MMPLQQNEADALRMDEDMLVTSRMMTKRASGLGRRGGRGDMRRGGDGRNELLGN